MLRRSRSGGTCYEKREALLDACKVVGFRLQTLSAKPGSTQQIDYVHKGYTGCGLNRHKRRAHSDVVPGVVWPTATAAAVCCWRTSAIDVVSQQQWWHLLRKALSVGPPMSDTWYRFSCSYFAKFPARNQGTQDMIECVCNWFKGGTLTVASSVLLLLLLLLLLFRFSFAAGAVVAPVTRDPFCWKKYAWCRFFVFKIARIWR